MKIIAKIGLATVLSLSLASCGSFGNSGRSSGNLLGNKNADGTARAKSTAVNGPNGVEEALSQRNGVSIFDALRSPDQNVNVRVNKYLWNASLETLNFLPVESADPFTGILVMGWGRAPGSGRQYRATILIQDPALDARSLKVSIQTRGGVASAETVRRIEDAILTRARQLRVRDKNL